MLIVVCAEIHEFHLFFVCFHLIDRVRMPQVWWLLSAICSVSLAPKHSTIWRCGCRYPSLYFSMGSSVYLGEHFFLFLFSLIILHLILHSHSSNVSVLSPHISHYRKPKTAAWKILNYILRTKIENGPIFIYRLIPIDNWLPTKAMFNDNNFY